jgi:predicted Zn-dependent protease
VETFVHEFRVGPFVLQVPGESYAILEYFNGSHIIPNTTASYIFLVVIIGTSIMLLALITILPRFWYFLGMGFFIVFLVSLRLEVLTIAGYNNRIPVIVALLMYILPSFYFNQVNTSISFTSRIIAFALVTLSLSTIIYLFSAVDYPFYHLTLTAYTPALILSILFIIMIAHEILAFFVFVVGQGSSKSLQHLSIISVIYMANVIITCLHELGVIEWNFVYINLYLLLTISSVLGLWGFSQREGMYQNIFPFSPYGAYFFLSLGAICFATTGQLLNNANDPAVKIIRDAIIFSHTGFGIIFLTYLFSNFILMLARNLPVYKVLYNPTRMPYFTFRLAGLIAMLGFVFYSGWRQYVFNGLAGFYNFAGDLHTLLDNNGYAESFYDQGRSQGFQNHRSNYALATLKASRYNFDEAHYNYELANGKRPTPYSLTNAGNLYLWENKNKEAIDRYHYALKELPDSGPIANNLGFAYAKTHQVDSSLAYLNAARSHAISKTSAETNFFALATMEFVPIKIDSVLTLFNSHPGILSNALALSTIQNQKFNTPIKPLEQKYLDLYTATLLNNYIIKYATTLDTAFIHEAHVIASDSLNEDYSEALKSSLAFAYYHRGNVTKALEILGELAYISQSYQGKFNYIMGLWALEQGNPLLASSYFTYSDTYTFKEAKFYNAIALSEARKRSEALVMWDTVANGRDEAKKEIAVRMRRILNLQATEVQSLNDAEKYQYCRYNIGLNDSVQFNRIVNSFENADYKAQALLDYSKRYYEADLLTPAIRYYNRIAGLELSNKKLYDDVLHAELLMLAYRGELRLLANQINKDITFDNSRSLEKTLYTALIAASSGDSTVAERNFEILASYNPYFEEGIIAAADFYRSHGTDKLQAYNILAEAIQINGNSIRLLKAYTREATRQGFDEYARSAAQRLDELEQAVR